MSEYIRRREIGEITGLGKSGVAALVTSPGFPSGRVLNARVILYPRGEVLPGVY
ncbi:MAG: hypothetical protein K0U44_02230 [Actinomycetia bacterium]|nr:hypothetical protein [Actinomycetes bacterium]MCH9787738.1 hypothetical protein [Actinomycetes bacterium]